MTPAELLADAKRNIERAVKKEVDQLLELVRGVLEKDPYEKFVRVNYSYELEDVVARGVEYALGQLGYRAKFVRRWLFCDYFEIAGWSDAPKTDGHGGPYRKVDRYEGDGW